MENSLIDLITQFSEVSGLSYRQMSLRAGLGESTVAIVVRGDRKPGFDFCVQIADVLRIRPEEALRLGGLLPRLPPAAEDEAELLHIWRNIAENARPWILRALRGLRAGEELPLTQEHSPSPPPPAARETGPPEREVNEENDLPLPRRGEVVEIKHDLMSLDDPLRRLIEDYLSIERDPEEADRRLRILLVLAEDALREYQDRLNGDLPPASEKAHEGRELSANDRLSDPLAQRHGI